MNTNPDNYFIEGCGRCSLYSTPQCKVKKWSKELAQLRRIALECGLTEVSKWGIPCYTFQQNNIVLVSAFKEYCALSFFKGALLQDANHILVQQTENVQASRQLRFTNVLKIVELEATLKAYIYEAIEVEKAGMKVELKKTTAFSMVEEFKAVLAEDAALKAAFEALTPGRQRAYLLHFSQPKQPKTRESRIMKCIPQIMKGKGLNDK